MGSAPERKVSSTPDALAREEVSQWRTHRNQCRPREKPGHGTRPPALLEIILPSMQLVELLSRLDPDPRVRGRQFERICAWYLRNAPEYRDRFRRVWLWKDWPEAWAPDAGIDLVAEEHDGDLWAIQAKAYDARLRDQEGRR